MKRKVRKISKVSLIAVGFSIAVLLGINWYLTHRLESFLQRTLHQKVSDATDGFYDLSFSGLSVGFFNGELTIDGVRLKPDSVVFRQWEAIDSLPEVYYNIHVERIRFRGINLTWRVSYKTLDFDLFEINTPKITAVNSLNSGRFVKVRYEGQSKSLYEMISPYVDALNVDKIDVKHVTVSYIVEDRQSPAVYGLDDFTFHAYGFKLDENSNIRGKLLYSDQLDFETNQPQTLLTNDHFILTTSSIKLSTGDSLIQIKDVNLTPLDTLSGAGRKSDEAVIGGKVAKVEAKGVYFERINSRTYLTARSFDIVSSDIIYFAENKNVPNEDRPDSEPFEPWSLYSLVSPVLDKVVIDKIGIDRARFKFMQSRKAESDVYMFDQLDFKAKGFRLDSVSDIERRFMYSDSYTIDAKDVYGRMNSYNQNVNVGRVYLDAAEKTFEIDDVKLSPISRENFDYFEGKVVALRVNGIDIDLDRGMNVETFQIFRPDIRYVRNLGRNPSFNDKKPKPDTDSQSSGLLASFEMFVVKNILVNGANIVFDDKGANEPAEYRLKGLEMYASNFSFERHSGHFRFGDWGFSFSNFDNYLPGKDYRLSIKEARFSRSKGKLQFLRLKLLPQPQLIKDGSGMYFEVDIPSIDVKGAAYGDNKFTASSVGLRSPEITITKHAKNTNSPKKTLKGTGSSFINELMVKTIGLENVKINYIDRSSGDSLFASLSHLGINDFRADVLNGYSDLSVGEVDVDELGISAHGLARHFEFDLKDIGLSRIVWKADTDTSFFNLGELKLIKPELSIKHYMPKARPAEPKVAKDIYTNLGDFVKALSVDRLEVIDGNVDYPEMNEKRFLIPDKLNKIDFFIDHLKVNAANKTIEATDFGFSTQYLSFPLSGGFYKIDIDSVKIAKKDSRIQIDGFHFKPLYAKTDHAYLHPKHKDWFDVSAGGLSFSGVDMEGYLSDNILKIANLEVSDVMFQNFKNQKIDIQHNIMPMIYEGIQKAPLKLDITNAKVKNFSVIYEELTRNGSIPGKISLMNMDGDISGLTNVVSFPNQYTTLDVGGYLMGTGFFTAKWMIPVDSLNDRFSLDGHIHRLDLTDMNQLVTPMAPVRVESGMVHNAVFRIDASSLGGTIDMRFLYNDLKIAILSGDSTHRNSNKMLSGLANMILRSNNPRKANGEPFDVKLTIVRDPYHSTFNYFWQFLQPALIESVGISKGKQNFGRRVKNLMTSTKKFLGIGTDRIPVDPVYGD